ncbi:MAG: hypothetical protein NTV61_04265 [Candidatus Bathyarchaeota archaeon]|nr:hypothetical protein [Candidatus Bathyarchaeota archaeon]
MGRAQEDKPREKKLIRAPEDLVDELNEAAALQGKTFYRYVTEIFEQALEANKMKRTLGSIIDSYKLSEISRKTGMVAVPGEFLEQGLASAYPEGGMDFLQIWYQAGRMYGLLLKGKFNDELDAFIRLVRESLWLVNEVEVKSGEDSVSLRFVAPSISKERSSLLLGFIEGALASLGYEVVEKREYKGIIDIKITPIS